MESTEILATTEETTCIEAQPHNQAFEKRLRDKVPEIGTGRRPFSEPRRDELPQEAGKNACDRLSYLYDSLQALSELYRTHRSLESLLSSATRLVVNTLDVEHCSIGWLDVEKMKIQVLASFTREGADINKERVVHAFSDLVNSKPFERKESIDSAFQLISDLELSRESEFISPLRVDRQIVGYVCGLKSENANVRDLDTERSVFFALSQQINAAIEAQRTREMLDFPTMALAVRSNERESGSGLSSAGRSFFEPINNQKKLVKKIAHGFFADLRKAGFETKQILDVATEILDSLLTVLQSPES